MLAMGAMALSGEAASRHRSDRNILSILTSEELSAEPYPM